MGYVIYAYWAYKTYPELYAVQSAAIMIKLIIWRKLNRQ